MEGDEFSAGEEEGDFEDGGGGEGEEMVEFVSAGENSSAGTSYCTCIYFLGLEDVP